MADDIPPYPYYQQTYAPFAVPCPPAPGTPYSAYAPPPVFQPPEPEAPKDPNALDCDYCGENIEEDEECINLLYGVAGPGQKSGRLMVQPSSDIPEGEVSLHLCCVSGFIEDSLPETADEIRQNFNIDEEPVELFCSNCDAKIDGLDAK